MNRRSVVLSFYAAIAIAGCGGGSGGGGESAANKQQISALETAGSIPNLERGTSVAGTDENNNGIRDDVETYIANTYSGSAQQAAARQFAGVMQAAMLVDKGDASAVKAMAVRSSRGVNCLYSRFDGRNNGGKSAAQVVQEIRAISTNTKPRLLAYLAYAKALDGTAGSLPEGDTCE